MSSKYDATSEMFCGGLGVGVSGVFSCFSGNMLMLMLIKWSEVFLFSFHQDDEQKMKISLSEIFNKSSVFAQTVGFVHKKPRNIHSVN